MKTSALFLAFVLVLFAACQNPVSNETKTNDETKRDTVYCPPGSSKLDIGKIEQVTGMKGTEKNGEYKITVPQNDLKVMVDGFRIIPPMGLGSWVAFTPCADTAMVMGDIILTETDLAPVQREVIRQGFSITAIHNHFVRNHPNILYMHVDAKGGIEKLSAGVKAIFDKVASVRGKDPKSVPADSVVNKLDIHQLDSIIGHTGEMSKGVYKYTIGRPDVMLQEHGIPISSFMGFNTWAAWQGTTEKAAVAGDFTMLENEVQPVIAALILNGYEVVAVHNHMVHEEPRIFFLHYWATGPVEKLARGFKQALDEMGKK